MYICPFRRCQRTDVVRFPMPPPLPNQNSTRSGYAPSFTISPISWYPSWRTPIFRCCDMYLPVLTGERIWIPIKSSLSPVVNFGMASLRNIFAILSADMEKLVIGWFWYEYLEVVQFSTAVVVFYHIIHFILHAFYVNDISYRDIRVNRGQVDLIRVLVGLCGQGCLWVRSTGLPECAGDILIDECLTLNRTPTNCSSCEGVDRASVVIKSSYHSRRWLGRYLRSLFLQSPISLFHLFALFSKRTVRGPVVSSMIFRP